MEVNAETQSQEDIIAAKILKRAELARITRQLKSKLFKAGLRVRGELETASSPLSGSSETSAIANNASGVDGAAKNHNINDIDQYSSPNKENSYSDENSLSGSNRISRIMSSTSATTTPLKRRSSIIMSSSKKLQRGDEIHMGPGDDLEDDLDHDNEVASIINSSQRLYTDKSDDLYQQHSLNSPSKKISIHNSYSNLPSSPFYMSNSQNTNGNHPSSSPLNNRIYSSQSQSQSQPNSHSSSHSHSHSHSSSQPLQPLEPLSLQPPSTPPPSSREAVLSDISMLKTPDKSSLSQVPDILRTPKSSLQSLSNVLSTPSASASGFTPMSNQHKQDIFKTPNSKYADDKEEGAELLLYLSNSPGRSSAQTPSIAQALNLSPTTPPKRDSNTNKNNVSTTPNKSNSDPTEPPKTPKTNPPPDTSSSNASTERFTTPRTPVVKGGSLNNNNGLNARLLNGQRTPGFSMSDYVNIFTPSPRYSRTPDVYTSLKNSMGNVNGNSGN